MERADKVEALLFVEMDEHLGVAGRLERVARAAEALAELAEVVDLAIEDDDDAAVLVVDRLIAGVEVDDAQALDAKSDLVFQMDAARVRPTVLESRAHLHDHRALHRNAVDSVLSN